MKKIILGLALSTLALGVNAQGLRVGVTGAYNSTWLFNKNVSDAGDELDYKSSFGGQIGVDALYNFKENAGVYIAIISNSVNQKYTNRFGNVTSESENKFKYISVPVLFRFTGEKGPYFEIGPEFSFGGKGKFESDAISGDYEDDDINKSNIAIALGFGVSVKASEQIHIDLGLRFAWGVSDVFKEPDGAQNYEPTNTAVGGLHLGVGYLIPSK